MTTKERAIQVIEQLPADATLDQIMGTLQHLNSENAEQPRVGSEPDLPAGGVWDLLEHAAGSVEMPADWASEHDDYLYGTPKRSPVA